MKIFKPNQEQTLVVFMEPPEHASDISLKAGNMILNRFCIDEDAGFELSGVNYFKKSTHKIEDRRKIFELKQKVKGMEYSFLPSNLNLRT